ncbi:hypothetical protein ACS0TY_023354 [Phlomoides rotata]
MMAYLAPVSSPKPLISTFGLASPRSQKVCACASTDQEKHVRRRDVALGLASVVLGLSNSGGNAWAAARRPPPPPPKEKKDPNVTGLAAKILASKKRKEAMEESIAKLREKGKLVQKPPPEPSQ